MSGATDAAHSCEQWLEPISARVDGELDPGELEDLDVHLASCEECSTMSAQIAAQHSQITIPTAIPSSCAVSSMSGRHTPVR